MKKAINKISKVSLETQFEKFSYLVKYEKKSDTFGIIRKGNSEHKRFCEIHCKAGKYVIALHDTDKIAKVNSYTANSDGTGKKLFTHFVQHKTYISYDVAVENIDKAIEALHELATK